jgi:hypothetical protein
MYPQQIIDALSHVRYPGTGKNLIESGMLEDDIRIQGFEVSFSLIFQKDNDPFQKSVLKAAETALKTYIDSNVVAHIHTKFLTQKAGVQLHRHRYQGCTYLEGRQGGGNGRHAECGVPPHEYRTAAPFL